MITISLCMIVKNEEDVLARCLESVKNMVDEIIIVDTGSEDKTKEIAREFTNKIYDFEWIQDFSKARNFAFSKATQDYQMWLDADDIVEPEELEKMIKLKKMLNPSVDVVTMRYHTHFDASGRPTLTSTRGRLFRRERNFKWEDAIHEYILMSGNIQHEQIFISHKKQGVLSDRNIKIYENLINEGMTLDPRQTYYYARELMDHQRYEDAIEYFNRFLDDGLGWYEDNIASCFNLSRCYQFIGKPNEILPVLFKSFQYDNPRAEICCQIGYFYKHLEDYKKAIFWFDLCLQLEKSSRGFVLNDYWDYIPTIELCACYWQLGDISKSHYYHLLVSELKPGSEAVAYNEEYFQKNGIGE